MTPPPPPSARGEFALIDFLHRQSRPAVGVQVGIGDDCAVLDPLTRPWVITTDTLMDGTDFRLAEVTPRQIGNKAMAVNLSDIAAMAAVPRFALISLVLPQSVNLDFAQELHRGLEQVANQFRVSIIGGDTNSWDQGLVIGVTVIGECTPRGAVLRSGAEPGDWLFVTGPLGGSIRARHLHPTPRVTEALRLHEVVSLHAMADISDGLARDLGHILRESGCGAEILANDLPIHADAHELAKTTGRMPRDHALTDGEDFELIFAVSPTDGATLLQQSPVPVWKIGECIEAGAWLITDTGREPWPAGGWAHQFGDAT